MEPVRKFYYCTLQVECKGSLLYLLTIFCIRRLDLITQEMCF